MWIGNLMLVILNLPLIGMWVKLLSVDYRLLYPAILLFCCIGVYSLNNSAFEVLLAAGFGLLGFALIHWGFEMTPLLLGFVLGPLMEENLRRAMRYAQGDPMVLVERPLSGALLAASVALLVIVLLPMIRLIARDIASADRRDEVMGAILRYLTLLGVLGATGLAQCAELTWQPSDDQP